jgi:cation diffusion facilitator family transporter
MARHRSQLLGYTEGWLSIALNTILFVVKYWAGTQSASVAMVADAWHTLSDTFTSVIILLSFWLAARPPDKNHPFGHGRAEVIAAIIIGTLLAVVGLTFLKESIMRLEHYRAAQFTTLAIAIFGVSVLVKEALAQYSFWAGKEIDSKALLADGWHHRSDAIASGLIVVGALAGSYFWWIDGVMGISVSALILYVTYGILKDAVNSILGERPDPRLEGQLQALITRIAPAASCVHHLHLHRYGDHAELTLHVKLPRRMNLEEAHELATRLEEAIRKELNLEPTIHLEPRKEAEERIRRQPK